MPELFEEDANRQKDYLVASIPLLRALVDRNLSDDSYVWFKVLRSAYPELSDEMDRIIGADKVNEVIQKRIKDAEDNDIFEPEMDLLDMNFMTSALIALGYALETEENIYAIYGDVYEHLTTSGIMEVTDESSVFALLALEAGAQLKRDIGDDLPDVFQKFTFDF